MRTRVKVCGITRIEDAQAAAAAGADAIGLVFDPESPRLVSIERARVIAAAMPPFVSVVALFVDATSDVVHAVLNRVNVSLLQFHGSETPEQCGAYARPYLKAIRMGDNVDLRAEQERFADAAGLLLDTFVANRPGGSGRTFDWARVPQQRIKPLVLAGGLTPANVGEAIRRVRPEAVDVSSGVEASKGIKDPEKIAAFLAAVREAA